MSASGPSGPLVQDLYHNSVARKLAFHRENGPFDEELVFFFKDGSQYCH